MASLKQSMFRSVPEKHCLGRLHHLHPLSIKFAIYYCYVKMSNRKNNKQKKPTNQTNKQKSTYLFWKQNQKLSLLDSADQRAAPLLTTPVLSCSFPTVSHCVPRDEGSLPHGRHTSASKDQSFSRSSPKQTRSIRPPPPSLWLLVCRLCNSFSGGVNRWEGRRCRKGRGKRQTREMHVPQFSMHAWPLRWLWNTQFYCSFTV